MDYNEYKEDLEFEEYKKYTIHSISKQDMDLENIITDDIYTISMEVGGQDEMYNNFPIIRVFRDSFSKRVYCLTTAGGIAIIERNDRPTIVTLGEDDGNFFVNSASLYSEFWGTKQDFVWALSEALSLYNNTK